MRPATVRRPDAPLLKLRDSVGNQPKNAAESRVGKLRCRTHEAAPDAIRGSGEHAEQVPTDTASVANLTGKLSRPIEITQLPTDPASVGSK
jgi:hypothetical protein